MSGWPSISVFGVYAAVVDPAARIGADGALRGASGCCAAIVAPVARTMAATTFVMRVLVMRLYVPPDAGLKSRATTSDKAGLKSRPPTEAPPTYHLPAPTY